MVPKGKSVYFKGIGLVDVIWKTISSFLNRRLMVEIKFHDVMYSLRVGCGMGTTTLESNLVQHPLVIREEVLFDVFMDL